MNSQFESVNELIDNYLVETGFVDDEILELKTTDKQFEMLKNVFNNYSVSIKISLTNFGYFPNEVVNMSQTLLNTYILDVNKSLNYVDAENVLVVGKQKPEKN